MDINSNPPKITTYRRPKKDIIKKLLTVMTMVFVLFVVPATVNVALSSQDTRNKAQVISDNAATDVRIIDNTTTNTSNDNILWKVYPFAVGVIIIIWGGLIIVYIGSKFRKRL